MEWHNNQIFNHSSKILPFPYKKEFPLNVDDHTKVTVQLQKGFKTINLMSVTKKKLQKRYETEMVMITESNKTRYA